MNNRLTIRRNQRAGLLRTNQLVKHRPSRTRLIVVTMASIIHNAPAQVPNYKILSLYVSRKIEAEAVEV